MSNKITPIFLFALPRSGSTLLQRMIAAHPSVATTSEPWLLLPCMDMLGHGGTTFSSYGHAMAIEAVKDFSLSMKGGEEALRQEVAQFVMRVYSRAAQGKPYFLDKTPRYHIFCESIIEMFPQAKFVFLFRNPLSTAASMIETFAEGKWYLYGSKFDLYDGQESLLTAFRNYRDRSIYVKYENVIESPSSEMNRIYEYLGLDGFDDAWHGFSDVQLNGRMKDPTGMVRYDKVSKEPMEKWLDTYNNVYRQRWARNYLKWLGEGRLSEMGYDMTALLNRIDALPVRLDGVCGDFLRSSYGAWRRWRQADISDYVGRRPMDMRHIYR